MCVRERERERERERVTSYDSLSSFFAGRKKKKNPFIVTVKQNFSTIMHPFAVVKEWCKYLGDRDRIKINEYVVTKS